MSAIWITRLPWSHIKFMDSSLFNIIWSRAVDARNRNGGNEFSEQCSQLLAIDFNNLHLFWYAKPIIQFHFYCSLFFKIILQYPLRIALNSPKTHAWTKLWSDNMDRIHRKVVPSYLTTFLLCLSPINAADPPFNFIRHHIVNSEDRLKQLNGKK